jgi:hypothetical protein
MHEIVHATVIRRWSASSHRDSEAGGGRAMQRRDRWSSKTQLVLVVGWAKMAALSRAGGHSLAPAGDTTSPRSAHQKAVMGCITVTLRR